uniref:Capsid associated tegument protein n=1 Tax=anatid alphaherpesvirus 1 TaxID=104388 RepID=A2TIV7_9ALPH|nr:capsid associated tegument protein [Anatid alphaherpesvirus 1]
MERFFFSPLDMCKEHSSAGYISDSRNFITPNWPAHYWTRSQANRHEEETAIQKLRILQQRNTAASAALDHLSIKNNCISAELEMRLKPIEEQVKSVTAVIADLENAAAMAEATDAADEIDGSYERSRQDGDGDKLGETSDSNDERREVQIVKNDTPLRYDTNLSTDLLTIIYSTRGGSSASGWGVLFGTWYRALQDGLITEWPVVSKRLDQRDGRQSKTFMTTAIVSLQATGRLYVGVRHYTALECAILCLQLHHRITSAKTKCQPFNYASSAIGMVEQLPAYLDNFIERLASDCGRLCYRFDMDRLPKGQFAIQPRSGERIALSGHCVLAMLIKHGVLPLSPGVAAPDGLARDVDKSQRAYVDEVNKAAGAVFGRAQPLFLMEDITQLRATINTITSLILMRKLLWNTNVYADRMCNNFQIGTLLPGAVPSDRLNRGASNGGAAGAQTMKSDNRNFAFLCERYMASLYAADPQTEITQMFPGLVALCLDARNIKTQNATRHVLDVSTNRAQAALLRLIAVELQNRSKTISVPIQEVLTTHDAVALQYEEGLATLMQQARLKNTLSDGRRLLQFNVNSDYDLIYFLCLGYIPLYASSM